MSDGGDNAGKGGGNSGGGNSGGGGRRRGGGSGGSGGGAGGGKGGGGRRGSGSGARRGSGGGGGGQPNRGRGPQGAGARSGAQPQQQPIEIAVRSSRNAIKRHAESIRDDQAKLGCRSLLMALHGNLGQVENPAEILTTLEQVQHVLHQPVGRDEAQLPVAIRAVAGFLKETPVREKASHELVRLLLRHLYALNSDFVPRQPRDDGRFRASANLDVLEQVAKEFLSDADFDRLRK
jgi:hypothetical protein